MSKRRTDESKAEIRAYLDTHTYAETRNEFRCSTQTLLKLGGKNVFKRCKYDLAIIQHWDKTDMWIAAHYGTFPWVIKRSRNRLGLTGRPVLLNLKEHRIPLTTQGRKYRLLGEWVIDCRGLAGVHEGVPVNSLSFVDANP